jgi:hypothetical protein
VVAGEPADAKGDVYSLGAILHDLLTGETPPGGAATLRRGDPRIAALVRSCLAAAPDERPALDEVIARLESRVRSQASEDCRVEIAAWLWERTRAGIPGLAREQAPSAPGAIADGEAERQVAPDAHPGARIALPELPPGESGPETGLAVALRRVAARLRAVAEGAMPAGIPRRAWRVPAVILAGGFVGAGLYWLQRGAPGPLEGSWDPGVSAAGTPAEISFDAYPWAEVSIDSGPSFLTPRAKPVSLAPGTHRVQFQHPSFGEVVRTIEVEPGTQQAVRHVFATGP